MPAEKIRKAAICGPFRDRLLSFISLKELPQMIQRIIKIVQQMNLLLIKKA